jgi:DNA-binding NarL/FixJ family response regulator
VHGRSWQASALDILTPREHDVLVEMARGASNGAIAKALGLTKRAVEKHINSVFAKLDLPLSEDVSRRVRAVLLFLGQAGGSDRVDPP